MSPTPSHRRVRRTSITILAILALVAPSGCGGDEPASTSDAPADPVPTAAAEDGAATDAGGSTVREVLTDAMGEEGDAVDEVLGSMSAESRFSIVVDQLDPTPALEIDGTSIRFVYDSGSVQDAILPCMVGGTFLEPGETLTIVYPDGESTC